MAYVPTYGRETGSNGSIEVLFLRIILLSRKASCVYGMLEWLPGRVLRGTIWKIASIMPIHVARLLVRKHPKRVVECFLHTRRGRDPARMLAGCRGPKRGWLDAGRTGLGAELALPRALVLVLAERFSQKLWFLT